MKSFKRFKEELNESRSPDVLDQKKTIQDLSKFDKSARPKAGKVTKTADIDNVSISGDMFPTNTGYAPNVKRLMKSNKKSGITVYSGDPIVYTNDFVLGMDTGATPPSTIVFWVADRKDFLDETGIR